MELTPEEKQKIYEEEKIRHEASEKVKSEAKQKKAKQTGLGCLIIIGFFILVGLLSDIDDKTQSQSSGNTEVAQEEQQGVTTQEVVQEVEPVVIDLSGSGQQASQKFTLEKGISIFKMTHSGTANFAITLMNSNGERVELLVNEIGKFDGAKAVEIPEKGEYILDVAANSKWSVKIEQPRPQSANQAPQTFTGIGQNVSPFISLNQGLVKFSMKHQGNANFAIKLMRRDGSAEDLLVNEIGNFDGSKAVGISRSGMYLMDISADGPWTISVE